jgi:anti-sigma B factor antagonist
VLIDTGKTQFYRPVIVKSSATVSAACFDNEVWIRIEGRGDFHSSGTLKQFIRSMIQRGYREFVVDLARCEHMDSTFMGTLTGISQNLKGLGQGSLRVLNVSPRNIELLENLGLNMLFLVEGAGAVMKTPPQGDSPLDILPEASEPQKEIVLSAHEALAEANPTNAERFRDVLEYLKKEDRESSL